MQKEKKNQQAWCATHFNVIILLLHVLVLEPSSSWTVMKNRLLRSHLKNNVAAKKQTPRHNVLEKRNKLSGVCHIRAGLFQWWEKGAEVWTAEWRRGRRTSHRRNTGHVRAPAGKQNKKLSEELRRFESMSCSLRGGSESFHLHQRSIFFPAHISARRLRSRASRFFFFPKRMQGTTAHLLPTDRITERSAEQMQYSVHGDCLFIASVYFYWDWNTSYTAAVNVKALGRSRSIARSYPSAAPHKNCSRSDLTSTFPASHFDELAALLAQGLQGG